MKTSVSMYSLNQYIRNHGWGIYEFIDYAKEIGADGVELLDVYWTNKDEEIDGVLAYLKTKNLPVSAYDVSNNFVKPTAAERKTEVDRVIEGIYTAKKLGTNIVRVFCGDLMDGITYDEGRAWIIEGFKACLAIAEQEQVYLAIENHGLFAGKAEQVKSMIDEIDSDFLKSTLDTGNFLLVQEDPYLSTKRLKSDVVHVHFKDFRKVETDFQGQSFKALNGDRYLGTVAGEGMINLENIISELKSVQYDGWYSIEYEGHEDSKECVKRSIEKLVSLAKG
ncbi:sugar phosphate isomerase/epimerase family protein [Pseudalkalibacillus sp. SCS-8]|uniref:sugar phosphate isomerase/epimerase family protein n=1 Tax=Pseudalkalibacillus nanhaiensis TaxID=3115291 RepID=UPI0032DADCFF